MFWDLLEFFRKSFAENILSQHEGTRSRESGVACLVAFCLGSMHVSWRHVGGLLGGPPLGGRQDVGRPKGCHGGAPLVLPLCPFMCDMKLGYFGISTSHPTPCLGL